MYFSRRDFLKISALSFCSLVVSNGLSGCSNNSNPVEIDFLHGVASGDPLNDKVIIWTRLTPSEEIEKLKLSYEVSKTDDFSALVHSGDITTSKDNDYTVKIDLHNLEEGTTYYYRFIVNGKSSIVGKTKTLSTTASSVKFAVFSCSNYTNGYFNAYSEASKISDLDVVLHLGDYIYEYGMTKEDDGVTPAYATENAQAINRVLPSNNDKELLTLEDYRRRYALYRTDVGSIALHKNVPFITVWDDHEIANDTYKNGAENHDDSEGEFSKRKEDALKAYFEWLPIRAVQADNEELIYRNFEFGNVVSLYMLDTRVIGRDKQLSYGDYFTQSGLDATAFQNDLTSSNRTLLGQDQLQWLQAKLAASTKKWDVFAQQVLMGKMYLPSEILLLIEQLNSADDATKPTLLQNINTKIGELVAIKTRMLQGDPTVTDQEKARVNTILPYNLDAWDGYAYEKEVILGTCKTLDKNLVVLSGDTHNSWANELKDQSGDNIGVEFATTSVSSPGMEQYVGLTTMQASMQFEGAISLLIDDLKYTNLNQRGFMTVEFTNDEVTTNWVYISSNDSTVYTIDSSRAKELKSLPGSSNRTIVS